MLYSNAWSNSISENRNGATNSPAAGSLLLQAAAAQVLHEHYRDTRRYPHARYAFDQLCELFPDACVETLSTTMLRQWVERLRADKNSASTINTKLSVVGVTFKHLDVDGCRVPYLRERARLQWWLSPELEEKAVDWLTSESLFDLVDYIRFITRTGLRVEEALRLQRQHFLGLTTQRPAVMVPGLKTTASQATLPLSAEATEIVLRRLGEQGPPADLLFPPRIKRPTYLSRGVAKYKTTLEWRTYLPMQKQWMSCRKAIGLADTPGATLKAFRRSFAYRLQQKGAPTELIRQMLRHESITTTINYLRVTGGFDTEMLRQWLK